MTEPQALTSTIYAGWHTYQALLIKALTPLSPEQLALRAAAPLRSIEDIATHVIGARARWFYQLMARAARRLQISVHGIARGCRRGAPLS